MRKRFFRAATLSILAGLLIAFLFAVPLMEQVVIEETEQQLRLALTLVNGYPQAEDSETLVREVAAQLEQSEQNLRLTIISENGQVLADSEAAAAQMEGHADRPEVRQALTGAVGRSIRKSETTGQRQLYLAQLRTLPDGTRQVVRAAVPLERMGSTSLLLWGCGLIGISMGLVVALFAANYSAGRVMEPLHKLTQAVRSVSVGDEPVHVADAPDEMGELSMAFNRMSERLAAAHRQLARSNEQMAGILQGMDDGVVAVNSDGTISLITNRARELLGPSAGTARRLSDCGGDYRRLQALLEQVMRTGKDARDVWLLSGAEERMVQVYAAPVQEEHVRGGLAVLSDITRLHKLEVMRSEFVANVTHELKTPLTSIRGYIELLKSGERDAETARSFYEIIEIEAERLQKLTDDLLQLSDIENGGKDTEVPLTPLADVVERVVNTLRPEAEQKQVELDVTVEPGLKVRAHTRRLYQLVKNLMENAVKYNRAGGNVRLTAGVEMGVAVIRVQDTGIGIPPEHLDRIFERFYRVDKGRSRELGGTGLGLSIVKHIVSLYGGDIRVTSQPGEGTTFTVRLNCT